MGHQLPTLTAADQERFWSKAQRTDSCWIWAGGGRRRRYGYFLHLGKHLPAHRLSYYLSRGVQPADKLVCHTCDVPHCVNPDHLFLGTPSENMKDCVRKGRWRGFGRARSEHNRGSENPFSKLTETDVITMRREHVGGVRAKDLAQRFGVSVHTVRDVVMARSWRHI